MIEVKTVIGYGSIYQGTSKVHGSPLGKEDAGNVKAFYGFEKDKNFVSAEVQEHFPNEIVVRENRHKKSGKTCLLIIKQPILT